MKKSRLDQVLVEREFYASREQAQRAIMAGDVSVNQRRADKASMLVQSDVAITTAGRPRFVSRGGFKLEGALEHFRLDVREQIAVDLGASTGGFTDCLLQRGARKVYAIDVGHGQLAWTIRQDARVVVIEKTNARTLNASSLGELASVCVADVSFISLTLILPKAFELIAPGGIVLALIKPQFELERAEVPRGGVVRAPELHAKATAKVVSFVERLGHAVLGTSPSVLPGADGNQEFFLCAQKRSA